MNNKDMHSHTSILAVGVATADADTVVTADLGSEAVVFQAAEILMGVGIGGITFNGTNKIEMLVEESSDNSTWTAVDDADILGATVTDGIVKSFESAHAAAAGYRVGYVGGKRYLRVTADFSGTHGTGTPLGVMILGGMPTDMPTADQI